MTTITTTLAGDQRACRGCGIAVDHPDEISQIIVNTFTRDGRLGRQESVEVARCSACVEVRAAAQALALRFPKVAAAQGGPDVAEERFEALLALSAALGVRISIRDERDLVLLLRDALPPAMALPFARRVASGQTDVNIDPWGHLPEESARLARDAIAAWMRARIERPRPIAPPAEADLRGCALCGVGTITALPSSVPWSLADIDLARVGGRPGAGRLWLALCGPCAGAIERFGVGRTAAEAALFTHLGITAAHGVETDLTAWATTGRPPGEPWEWVDPESLRSTLRREGALR